MTPERVASYLRAALAGGGRVLLTRLVYLGDVVLTLPAASLLKSSFPAVEIDYLSKGPGADLLRGEPLFRRVLEVPDSGVLENLKVVGELRESNYVLAVDFLSNPRSALLCYLSGSPFRIGGTRRVRRRLYTHQVRVPPQVRSAVLFHQHRLDPLGLSPRPVKPELHLSPSEMTRAEDLLSASGAGRGRRRVVIHPGGKWEVKRWPLESFIALGRALERKLGTLVVVPAGPGEEERSRNLASALGEGAVSLPPLGPRRLAAVLSRVDAVVANDGGVMHAAVAVGTPTVGIFGSSEPEVWFPYEGHGPYLAASIPVDCRPCHRHTCSHITCLRALKPEMVEELVVGLLGEEREESIEGDSVGEA